MKLLGDVIDFVPSNNKGNIYIEWQCDCEYEVFSDKSSLLAPCDGHYELLLNERIRNAAD